MKETAVTYQVTTFTVTVEGITPTAIFSSGLDSTKYIDDVVGNILDFVHAVATSADFDTAMIQSISILPPEPMTDEEVGQLIEAIKNQIESKLTDTEKEGKTDEQIAAMVQGKLAAMSSSEIQWLMEEAGVDKVTATITIKIWTYKGA
jgi:hypothetical protein